jgi:hypothetical protein
MPESLKRGWGLRGTGPGRREAGAGRAGVGGWGWRPAGLCKLARSGVVGSVCNTSGAGGVELLHQGVATAPDVSCIYQFNGNIAENIAD